MKKAACLLSGFIFLVVFTSLFLFFSSSKVFAGDIVINEFAVASSQWVELYNKGSSTINISGWFIDDSGGSQKYTIPDNTTLAPSEFKVFESGIFNFNTASTDVAQLVNGSNVEDSYSYPSGPNGATYGRQSDGGNDWVVFATDTKGSSNNSATVVPTPTLTPSPTLTPTKVPTPTKTPTTMPTSIKTPTSTPFVSLTANPTITGKTGKPLPTKVLGSSTKSALLVLPTAKPSKKPSSTVKVERMQTQQDFLPLFFIGGGVLLVIACGILTFQPQLKELWEKILKR